MELVLVMLQDPDGLVPVFVAEFPFEAMNVVAVALEPGTYCCVLWNCCCSGCGRTAETCGYWCCIGDKSKVGCCRNCCSALFSYLANALQKINTAIYVQYLFLVNWHILSSKDILWYLPNICFSLLCRYNLCVSWCPVLVVDLEFHRLVCLYLLPTF